MPNNPLPEILTDLPSGKHNDPAILYCRETSRDGDCLEIISYGEFERRVARVAKALRDLGLNEGDRLALWLPNVPAWLILYLAAARLGIIAVAVNTRFRAQEVADIIARSAPKALALWPGFKGIDFSAILGEVPIDALSALHTIITYDEGEAVPDRVVARRTVRYADLEKAAPVSALSTLSPSTPSILFTTSGTTRAPKFVVHDHRSITAHARDVALGFGFTAPDAVILQALPLCGVFGFSQSMATLAAGCPMVMLPAFDGAKAARLISANRVTHFNGADEMFLRVMEAADTDKHSLASLRLGGYAAFANAQGSVIVAEGDKRGITLVGLYGMSEVQALYARHPETASAERRALAGGIPVSPRAKVRVRDPESGALLPPGQAGELELAGPSRFAEYWNDPAATEKTLTADGFVRSGDLGYVTDDGGFVFLTRMGDSLRLSGFLVNPAEIENFIEREEGVSGCQVVGVESARGTRPFGFVTLAPGAAFDEASLLARCGHAMAKYKVPVRIVALDTFPVTVGANGVKIQRAKLREMATAKLGEA